MRISAGIGFFLCLVGLTAFTEAAPPKDKPTPSSKVDADVLPAGSFVGTISSTPNSDRMFRLKVSYPEVRLKPGAQLPNLNNSQAQYLNSQYRQLMSLQRQMGQMQHHRVHNMIQMQQMYNQMQMAQQRTAARLQQQELQQELRLQQQEMRAIQNMYQVVQVTREIEFQADANVKVRIKDLPEQFDDKGNIKKYTREQLSTLKGKDKELIGYESSLQSLQPGQVVMVTLRNHKKSSSSTISAPPSKKEKADGKEAKPSAEHKMQATMVVILKDGDTLQSASAPPPKPKK